MRRQVLQNLLLWKNKQNRKPLILNGARQVGKTYLLKEFGNSCYPKTHYINFEKSPAASAIFEQDLQPRRILQELQFFLESKIEVSQDLVIFDEIQACPLAVTSLKYFCEEMPQLSLCTAGSTLGLTLGNTSFPVGKVDLQDLWPFSFREFLEGIGETQLVEFFDSYEIKANIPEVAHQRFWEYLKIYFIVGGLPEAIITYQQYAKDKQTCFEQVRATQETLITTYIADMAKHSGKQNAMQLERIWRNIPQQLAKNIDGKSTKYQFKGVLPNIDRYSRLANSLDWLQSCRLTTKIPVINSVNQPLSSNIKEHSFKLYLFDVGLLGALSALSPATISLANYGSYKGYFAENFVVQELLAKGVNPLFCWCGRTSEIEFVFDHKGEIVPIEVKSGLATHSKSLAVFVEKYSPKHKVILSGRNTNNTQGNTLNIPLYLTEHLTKLESG